MLLLDEKENKMNDYPRLIEHAFPLKQTSLDSVHEKNVRHGHISTLHIWPARRPLAACRAALIATLLPDPSAQPKPEGMSDEEWQKEIIRQRQELCEKIGGKVVKKIERKRMPGGQVVEREKEATEGGILHWGRETENKATLDWFRQEIRKAYGGRAPKVLDPFAGGGSIPLEAMRLGCEATAVDINPVAWFILKCTLEYPQKLAGKTWPLPEFILEDDEFMLGFYKAHPHLIGRTKPTKQQLSDQENIMPGLRLHKEENDRAPKADLAWHVRAWGRWVLDRARRELAQYYPAYADFQPLDLKNPKAYEKLPMQFVPPKEDGNPDIDALNKEFSAEYLADKRNPRWIAKPTVAYLWARTVTCKNCRATLPLLKTRWLCKKEKKRILLTMEPNTDKTSVVFGVQRDVPNRGGNAAQNREHDKRIGGGTMSRAGAKCPCCGTIMMTRDMKIEGRSASITDILTCVISDGQHGKEYRLPTEYEVQIASISQGSVEAAFMEVPFGVPDELLPTSDRHRAVGSQLPGYGYTTWQQLFTKRQLVSLAQLLKATRTSSAMRDECRYPEEWNSSIEKYLVLLIDKVADYGSSLSTWIIGLEAIRGTFSRFAFSWTWDYCETNPIGDSAGSYRGAMEWTVMALDYILMSIPQSTICKVTSKSVLQYSDRELFDLIVTDPPYYDAIPYADLMDFFYVWLKRSSFREEDIASWSEHHLSPNWDALNSDGELIDDPGAYHGNKAISKKAYEDGMADAFRVCNDSLRSDGCMVVVFASKQPDAWEALAGSMIRAGFIIEGSWPIQTERGVRTNAITTASLASSVWLVCKKRPVTAKPGWDNLVMEEMRRNIQIKLREFWDAGIRGPDFVWAATGPALEAYSKHPVVKKANAPGEVMKVSEFLGQVRKIVVDFVVGRVLSGDGNENGLGAEAEKLDEPTAYYLLHRHDFGMDEAPAGACILYAISCGISDKELASAWDLVSFTKGKDAGDEEEESDADAEADPEAEEGSGSKVKLKTWAQRNRKSLGYDAPGNKAIPLIDRVHCLMHLWRAGDLRKVDEYLDDNALRRQELFKRLVQSLIELSPSGSEERSLLESLSNHIGGKGAVKEKAQRSLSLNGVKTNGGDVEEAD